MFVAESRKAAKSSKWVRFPLPALPFFVGDTRAEAAKLLEELTGAHRTSCYRSLRLNGRFARHLRADERTLSGR